MSLTRSTSADGAILTVQIKGKFDFNLVQYNTPLASELFQFTIPATAEVDDQRVK